jgi:hypothetical protein
MTVDHERASLLRCPAWCQHPDGHEFDTVDATRGQLVRYHEQEGPRLELLHRSANGQSESVYLEFAIEETGADGMTTRSDPYLLLMADMPRLQSSEARELGRLLISAADQLERLADDDTSTTTGLTASDLERRAAGAQGLATSEQEWTA